MSRVRHSTGGFTMVELLVVVVIGALILGATYQVLAVQERSYRQQGTIINTQQTMRGALAVLESELREISSARGDLMMMTAESLTFRAYRAAGFICDMTDQAGQRIIVRSAPGSQFKKNAPLLYFVENVRETGADDGWETVIINSPPTSGNCPAAGWGGAEGTVLNVPGFPFSAGTVFPGAPVRSYEVFTYGLYEVGGEWVLARREPGGSLVPIIGPLAPGGQGLAFRYFDANGVETTNPLAVARVEIVVRARTQGTGVPGQTHYTDSLVTQLFLRNN